MLILRNFILAVAQILNIALTLYMWVVIVLHQIRKRVPVSFSGIDFSPIIVILLVIFLQSFLVKTLIGLAGGLM